MIWVRPALYGAVHVTGSGDETVTGDNMFRMKKSLAKSHAQSMVICKKT